MGRGGRNKHLEREYLQDSKFMPVLDRPVDGRTQHAIRRVGKLNVPGVCIVEQFIPEIEEVLPESVDPVIPVEPKKQDPYSIQTRLGMTKLNFC